MIVTLETVKCAFVSLVLGSFLVLMGCSSTPSNPPPLEAGKALSPMESGQPSDSDVTDPGTSAGIAPENLERPGPDTTSAVAIRHGASADGSLLDHSGALTISTDTTSAAKKVQPLLDEALNYCEVSQEFWQKGELDNALEALDQAYRLILEVDTSDRPKLIQQKEDLRFLISKRILEIYASRNIVVNGNHNAIPMVINKYVQAEIDRFTRGHERNFFIESYVRSGRYRPKIIAELEKAGLPTELSWLPLIESGFKVKALSRARALGLWQFIPSTGYKFGLSRDKYVDERLDPDKATEAAIAYLKELHQIFGDWTTVLAAYNCGEGRVLRVIREQNVNYLDNFWDLYERLPYETARYVPRFLATLHIVENLERYGFDHIAVDSPIECETLEIQKQVHLKSVADAVGTSEKHLIDLNPELRYKILPPETYQLKVPPETGQLLLSKLDTVPESKLPTRPFVYHRVRRGETLSIIARKYRTRVRTIMRANNLRSSHYIVAGRLLKIPTRSYSYRSAKPVHSSVSKATKHVVRRGDNLWNIAKRYGTTTTKIQELNNLTHTQLHIGQVLKLPGDTEFPKRGQGLKVYQVKRGDSPFTIAQQHNMPLNRFLRINRLSSRSTIFPGQELYVE
jgi:membrane-bound lytic murein transglycosylase D